MNADGPLFEFRGVTKQFNGKVVLDGVDLQIYEGDVTTIIGKSGVGKSVLLKHIIGLLSPDVGRIFFRNQPIDRMSRSRWDAYRRRISYMFQNNALFDSMTVFENIALPLEEKTKLKRSEIEGRVMEKIDQLELSDVPDQYPAELSGGMQKRVALARALVTDPEIVLFDEPTTGQDLIRRNAILGMIAEYKQQFGFTTIMISHDIPDVFFISNRIIVLNNGEVIFQGTPEELEQFENPFLEEFIESLEGFQENLTGLHSRRHFKVRYQTALSRKHPHETFAVVLFSVNDLQTLSEHLGHEKTQEVLRAFGAYINQHLGAEGGFSVRHSRNQFATVLPFSDPEEAEELLQPFAKDLQQKGLGEIEAEAQKESQTPICFEFSVSAGVAAGQSSRALEEIFEEAETGQKTIAQFWCEGRTKSA